MSDEVLRQEAEELYGLVPGEFTAARNAASARLREGGDRDLADRVKGLRKPAAAAWVVNQLVRHDAEEMAQVLELGASLRQAQADLDGDALRELTRQRRRLVAAVAGKGRGIARDLGVGVSDSVLRQVEETLHAAMIDTDAEAAVRTGLLVDPLTATGLGSLRVATAVADHTALGGPGPHPTAGTRSGRLRAVPEPEPEPDPEAEAEALRERRRAERAAAEKELRQAETDLETARRQLTAREQRVSELQARTLQVTGEIEELRRRLDALEDRLERLDEKTDAALVERDDATAQVAPAEAAVAAARSALEHLEGLEGLEPDGAG